MSLGTDCGVTPIPSKPGFLASALPWKEGVVKPRLESGLPFLPSTRRPSPRGLWILAALSLSVIPPTERECYYAKIKV